MTTPDHGVDLLLRRSADDLPLPDVERLVAGGVARGRTRRRRARAATALAALAVTAVVGAGAVLVPWLGADASRSSVAGDPTTPTPTPTPTPSPTGSPSPTGTPAPTPPGPLAVRASQIPALLTDLLPGSVTDAPERTGGLIDGGPRTQVAHFLWNGTLTSVGAIRGETSAEGACAGAGAGTVCTERPDGSTLLTWGETGPAADGGVSGRGVSLFLAGGWEVFAISYNAADGKDAPVLAPEPPLTHADLEQVVSSARWFG